MLQLPSATGGNAPLTYTLTPASQDFAFDASALTLTGTPTGAAGRTRYTYTVTDDDGDTDTLQFNIELTWQWWQPECDVYDTNPNDRVISTTEALDATDDFFDGVITAEVAAKVLSCFYNTRTPTNNAPTFDDGESTTRSVAENTSSGANVGSAVSASDSDNDTLTYSLGGTDASRFSIDTSNGQLMTNAALNFESISSYSVTVTVNDGNGGSDSISVTITVTNVSEPGRVELSTLDPDVGTTITATLTDPDGNVRNKSWQWQSSSNGTQWSNIPSATGSSYAVVNDDRGKRLRATVSYRDGHGTGSARSSQTSQVPPAKVAGLMGKPGPYHGEIMLSWDLADGATGYQVRQQRPGHSWIELPGGGFVVSINVSAATAVVGNLDPTHTYVYQVRATNAGGEGAWSDSTNPPIAVRDETPTD